MIPEEDFYKKILDEAREVLTDGQLRYFIENCISDINRRVSSDNRFIEKELKLKKGTIKSISQIITSRPADDDKRLYSEEVFHRLCHVYEVDFYDELKKTILHFEQNPGWKTYKIFFLDDYGLSEDELKFSIVDSTVTILEQKSKKQEIYEFRNHKSFDIETKDGELRQISLDRRLSEEFEEIICGREELVGIDLSLISTRRLIFVRNDLNLSRDELEKICLYLVNSELQQAIYPEDIYLFSVFIEEVSKFVRNNRWFKITMPKFLFDAFIQYLYYFKTYVYNTKSVEIEIEFVNHDSFFIVKINSQGKVADYIISEWLVEYIGYIDMSSTKYEETSALSELSIKERSYEAQRLKIQVDTLLKTIAVFEVQHETMIEITKQIEELKRSINNKDSSIELQVIYGGNNQFANRIINYPPILDKKK